MIHFADDAVKQAALHALDVEQIDSEEQLGEVNRLWIKEAHVLDDLPRFPQLRDLDIERSSLRSGAPLAQLVYLTHLSLWEVSGWEECDLRPLTRLRSLEIYQCPMRDLSAVSGMQRLESLSLHQNGITDISPLSALGRLRKLDMHDNPVEDISPLLELTRLQHLKIDLDRVKDKSILNRKPFVHAMSRYETDVAEAHCIGKTAPKKRAPRVEYLGNLHPRMHFCRDAALLRLRGGMERIVCRDGGIEKDDAYDLYLDEHMLIHADIGCSPTYRGRMRAGYGDGLTRAAEYLAARDRLNAGFENMRQAAEDIAPLLGLFASGLYAVADMEMFPVVKSGKPNEWEHFWDAPGYEDLCKAMQWYSSGATEYNIMPHYLFPTQRASAMNGERVEEYMRRMEAEGEKFPRAAALYLSGSVALLLDGHHKAAAAAALGRTVRTLVIFPIRENQALEEALHEGKRLYLHQHGQEEAVVIIRSGAGEELSTGISLRNMKRTRVYVPAQTEEIPWGKVPPEYHPRSLESYPFDGRLRYGTHLPPDQVQQTIAELMASPKWAIDEDKLSLLRRYANLFPDSRQLTPTQRAWIREAEENWMNWRWMRPADE